MRRSLLFLIWLFLSKARVSLENATTVTMSELQVGDIVKTGEKKFIVCNIKKNVAVYGKSHS